MTAVTTFDSSKESLIDLLKDIRNGKMQLPDFQRGWIWDNDHITSLLASISQSYPIGAIMMLQVGGEDIRFKPRVIEGVEPGEQREPERMILDGQQRLTSLFQSLYMGKAVATKDSRNKPLRLWYYLDIAKALDHNGDYEDAIVAVPEDRKVRNFRNEIIADYSSIEKECAAELLPLPLVYDTAGLTRWQMQYLNTDGGVELWQQRMPRWNALLESVVQRFQQYMIPVIVLKRETPKEAVCLIFEKVNTGGVSLTVFELLTATFAIHNFNLREDWEARARRLRSNRVLGSLDNTDFLQAITLLSTRAKRVRAVSQGVRMEDAPGISCKRREILRLSLDEYLAHADAVEEGLQKSAKLLYGQKIFNARDLPYNTQLVPLAAILAVLGNRADNDGVRSKLIRWYWCGIFGELYGGAVETRFARDLPEVLDWVDGGPEPLTIAEASFAESRLLTLRTRNAAAYKGLHAVLMRDGGLDFRTGDSIDLQTYFDESIDIHHIFPKDWSAKSGIDDRRCNSIVNKTPLSARTNRLIGGKAPSEYLTRIEKSAGIKEDRMNQILNSHIIKPDLVRSDDFDAFFESRREALVERIEGAMGKPVNRDMKPAVGVGLEAGPVEDEAWADEGDEE
ncbi:MAG: DUF262 domain-containing protein [Dehalococcoidia bacterium]